MTAPEQVNSTRNQQDLAASKFSAEGTWAAMWRDPVTIGQAGDGHRDRTVWER